MKVCFWLLITVFMATLLQVAHGQASTTASDNASLEKLASAPLPQEPLPDLMISDQSPIASSDAIAGASSPWKEIRDIFDPPFPELKDPGAKKPSLTASPPEMVPHLVPEPASDTAPLSPVAGSGSNPIQLPPLNFPPRIRMPKLSGILIISEDDKTAILDSRIVREGETINGFKLLKIRKNSVLLKKSKEEHTIYVQP